MASAAGGPAGHRWPRRPRSQLAWPSWLALLSNAPGWRDHRSAWARLGFPYEVKPSKPLLELSHCGPGKDGEFLRSSGGLFGRDSDQPPHPTSGRSGRLCNQARQTSEMVPARPPMTRQASPDRAMSRLRASPMPHGTTTVAGQSGGGIRSGGMMLNTRPPAAMARSAATRVAGLPQPLTRVMPCCASSAPACPASSYAADPGSALPRTQT